MPTKPQHAGAAPAPPSGGGKPSGQLIVCGQRFAIDNKVVNFQDDPKFSAYYLSCFKGPHGGPPQGAAPFAPAQGRAGAVYRYRERRLMGGKRENLRRLQEIIRQFVVHHDGCQTSADCFHVLHDERGLSVHFLIDNDGTIYQTLDLADCSFHAGGVNEISLGVELCNRGKVELDGEGFYKRKFGKDRPIEQITIHNSSYRMWGYTDEQYDAMIALGRALGKIFPNLPQVYPQLTTGDLLRTWIADPRVFAGYMGHYHVTNQKWDPGAFDFKRFTQKIKNRATWFVCLSGECDRAPEIAEELGAAEAQAQDLVRNNEEEAMGGFFPVGPFSQSRLWHGGMHFNLGQGSPVFCPFPGRIVAARSGDEVATGSRNFVLTRHNLTVAGQAVTFYMLFFHLEKENPDSRHAPPWFAGADKKPFWGAIQSDEVAFPQVDVSGGELIGHVGEAGPPGNFEGQMHLEVMAAEEIGAKLDPGFWTAVDGTAPRAGHFCEAPEILGRIDRPRGKGDGILTPQELREFFRQDPARLDLRKMAVRFPSEWGASSDWEAALLRSKDYAKLPKGQRARLYRDQVEPTLWWTEEVARETGLPADFVVWHYHPVRFVAWMNQQLRKQATTTAGAQKAREGKAADQVLDDAESLVGFTDDEDELSIEAGKRLTLDDLAAGYPEEQKK